MKGLWRFPKENKKPWCSYLAAKYLSNDKNGLTNPPLKYPAKVLFGTERLSGRTWARLWLGNEKLIHFWDDVWPCHFPQRCMPKFISIHKVLMTSKWWIQYEGEKKKFALPIQLPIQEHLASEYFYSFFSMDCINFIFQPNKKTEYKILACGNVIRILYPKFFFLWKQEMESVVLNSALFHEI